MSRKPPLDMTGGTRTFCTYVFIYRVMENALQQAKHAVENKQLKHMRYNCAVAIVFSAFTIEAYLNHLGLHKYGLKWKVHINKEPDEKLSVLAKKIGYKLDKSVAPFKSFGEIFSVRNQLAHGKNETITYPGTRPFKPHKQPWGLKAHWETLLRIKDTERIVADTIQMLTELDKRGGHGGNFTKRTFSVRYDFIALAEDIVIEPES